MTSRKLLKKGENVWGVMLGNSFWRVEKPTDTMRYVKTDAMPDFSAGRPYLIRLEAHIKTSDGKEKVVMERRVVEVARRACSRRRTYTAERTMMRGSNLQAGTAPGSTTGRGTRPRSSPLPRDSSSRFTAPPITAHEVFDPVKIVSPKSGGVHVHILTELLGAPPVHRKRERGTEDPV